MYPCLLVTMRSGGTDSASAMTARNFEFPVLARELTVQAKRLPPELRREELGQLLLSESLGTKSLRSQARWDATSVTSAA